MTSRLTETTVDCSDPRALAAFWCAVLGYAVLEESADTVEIGPGVVPDQERLVDVRRGPVAATIVFDRVPEPKSSKNRLHFDVSPIDTDRDAEVDRLLALGATRADIGQGPQPWVVLADPEGNEFCVLRSLAPGEFP
jgi:catechol 2,3-dioxygenase-like lactoylglutathione lyase family enzyme